MKKYVKFICLGLVLANIVIFNVNASSGKLKKSSIISCNGIIYGQHSSDNHWHIATQKENGDYYPAGDAIYSNPCINDSPTVQSPSKQPTTQKRTTTKRTTTSTTTTRVIRGCTDTNAINYNSTANISDNSCQYKKEEVVIESIPYETIIESETKTGNEIIVQEGKSGSKEVTYQKIIDSNGTEISSYKTNETIIEKPINQIIKYEENKIEKKNFSPTGIFVLLVIYLTNYLYISKEEKVFSILNNIKKIKTPLRILLYILYYLYVIPVIIDFVSILIYSFKKGNKNANRA